MFINYFTFVLIYSPVPEIVDNSPKETSSDNGVANEAAARAEVPLTPEAPSTSLQIRLVDGTRLVATFNLSHTIGDIRRYIIAYPFNNLLLTFYCIKINHSVIF